MWLKSVRTENDDFVFTIPQIHRDDFLKKNRNSINFQDMSWSLLIQQANEIKKADDFLTDTINLNILDHEDFSHALAFSLAFQFAANINFEKWHKLFLSVYQGDYGLLYNVGMETHERMSVLDLVAITERDPACDGLVSPFLYNKGFKALQCHRIAHVLWKANRKDAARALQSRCSELYDVDIHPGAVIDSGLMLDHGSGVVIGETAVIGKNCSFLHGVTLGSTGKDSGDRHPKVGSDVLIGCNAILLGNISIGDSCKIGSGSIVLRSLPSNVTAVGNPAKIVGTSLCSSSAQSMDIALHNVVTATGVAYDRDWNNFGDGI